MAESRARAVVVGTQSHVCPCVLSPSPRLPFGGSIYYGEDQGGGPEEAGGNQDERSESERTDGRYLGRALHQTNAHNDPGNL